MGEERNASMNNTAAIIKLENVNLDDYNTELKCAFAIVSMACIVYSILALLALQRTKLTPETTRFFVSALIGYDILAVLCFSMRKFAENHFISITIQLFGVSFCNLAFITIGLMSCDRLIVFCSPYFYLRYITSSFVKKTAVIFWTVYYISYWIMRVAVCVVVFHPFTYLNVIGVCNEINFYFYGFAIVFVSLASVLCYIKIFMIIRKEHIQVSTTGYRGVNGTSLKTLRQYRSTSLVLVFSLTTISSAVMYAILISLKLEPVPLRLWTDAINTFCCMMDPLVYVMWFRECRMEILKMLSTCFPSLKSRVEQNRRQIFNIT